MFHFPEKLKRCKLLVEHYNGNFFSFLITYIMINTSLNLFFNNFSNFNNNNEIENMIFNSKCIDFRYISYIVENINQNLNKYQLFNSNNITNSEIYYINENSKKSKRYESNNELDGFINKKNKLFDEKFEFIYLKTRGSAVFIKLNY